MRATRHGIRSLTILLGAALFAGACARSYVIGERGPQAHYQTAHPLRDTSRELERIFLSVKRIQVTGYYRTYRFAAEDSITKSDLRRPATYSRAIEQFTFDHTRAGTATIISHTGRLLSLITNEHVTRVPDTVFVYFASPGGDLAQNGTGRFLESVSIRTRQRNLVLGLAEPEAFRIIARDSALDIAVIGVDLKLDDPGDIRVLNIRRGDASRLVWGSFVYVLGYPRGFPMVTRAIVSDPNRGRDNSFLLDGLFNRGISGGLILAVRGDTEELEWVGMAMAASAQHEFILLPDDGRVEEAGMLMPYEGRLHIERVTRIDYGITFSVPMTSIRRFMSRSGLWGSAAPPDG
jgi:S1-C subfamily serine protease